MLRPSSIRRLILALLAVELQQCSVQASGLSCRLNNHLDRFQSEGIDDLQT